MVDQRSEARKVAVIGGGIAGLAAAHRLLELDPSLDVTLLEAAGRLGGVLETVRRDGFLVERSADNFITNVPWAIDLCRRIGFDRELLQTDSGRRRAFVVSRGRLREIPEGFLIMAPSRIWPMIATPILSWRGKLRLLSEYFVSQRQEDGDESLASFARRRLGRETYERLVQPLVGGIYTADPERLSIKATLPRFLEMERDHGSLIRATLRQAKRNRGAKPQDSESSGARYSMFVAPRDGMSSLVAAIASRLPEGCVQLDSPVERLERSAGGDWSISIGGAQPRRLAADAVIVATPAHQACGLLQHASPEVAGLLGRIPHAPCAIVSLGYRREQVGHALNGFGFVAPLVERRQILSGSFSSVKYAGRAPEGCELFRVFVGGACQSELAALPEDELFRAAEAELRQLLDIHGEPVFQHVTRWGPTMPQYHVGHIDLVANVTDHLQRLPGLHLAGNAYHGVGIPNCIHSGEMAASHIAGAEQHESARQRSAISS